MDMAACDLFMETYPNNQTVEKMLEIRPYNADKTKNMRSLNPEGNSTISCYPSAAVHCLPQSQEPIRVLAMTESLFKRIYY